MSPGDSIPIILPLKEGTYASKGMNPNTGPSLKIFAIFVGILPFNFPLPGGNNTGD